MATRLMDQPTRSPAPPVGPATADPAARWLGGVLIGLGATVAALSILGPLVAGVIEWRITPTILSQLYGLDAVSLAVVAPLAVVAGVLALRGSILGAVLGFGPAAYVVYMVPQYVLGPDYLRLPGDNERWFPLLLALFVLGLVAAVLAWTRLDPADLDGEGRAARLVGRWLLPAAAVLVFARYPVGLADWMSAEPTAKDYLAGPTFGWTIALLDLGVALPATVAVCVGVRRGALWAVRGLYAIVGWYALVGVAVAAMAVAMQARDDPAMSAGQMLVMCLLGALMAALAVILYVPLLRRALGGRQAGAAVKDA